VGRHRLPGTRERRDGLVDLPARHDVLARGPADDGELRVRDLDAVLDRLRAAGVTVDERVEETENGRFGWAVDPEGNRFELWQPPG